jgi:hypothetical protein
LQRQEHRLERVRGALARVPADHPRERHDPRIPQVLPFRPVPRLDGQLELFATASRPLRLARSKGWVKRRLRLGRRHSRWERDPERAARLAVFRLASRAMPKPIREALWLLRGLGSRHR